MLLDLMVVCSDHLDQPVSTMEYSLTFGNPVKPIRIKSIFF